MSGIKEPTWVASQAGHFHSRGENMWGTVYGLHTLHNEFRKRVGSRIHSANMCSALLTLCSSEHSLFTICNTLWMHPYRSLVERVFELFYEGNLRLIISCEIEASVTLKQMISVDFLWNLHQYSKKFSSHFAKTLVQNKHSWLLFEEKLNIPQPSDVLTLLFVL